MTKATYRQKLLIRVCCFRGWFHNRHGRHMTAGRQALPWSKLRSYILIHKHEVEKANWEWYGHSLPQWHTSINKATPPIPSQRVPSTGGLMSLWRPFSFIPPQQLSTLFFETGSLTGLELIDQANLFGHGPQRSSYLHLHSARIMGVDHNAWLLFM